MKFTIKDLATKTFPKRDGTGNLTIITVLTEDAKKIKAWQSRWTDENLVKGKEVEVETQTKPDRDGFDELWIVAPRGNRQFAPRNILPDAYAVAIKWMVATGAELNHENLDTTAAYFKEKFWTMNAPNNSSQQTNTEPGIDPTKIPF